MSVEPGITSRLMHTVATQGLKGLSRGQVRTLLLNTSPNARELAWRELTAPARGKEHGISGAIAAIMKFWADKRIADGEKPSKTQNAVKEWAARTAQPILVV